MQVIRTWKQNLKTGYQLLNAKPQDEDLAYILFRIRKVYLHRYNEYLS